MLSMVSTRSDFYLPMASPKIVLLLDQAGRRLGEL